LSGTSRAVFISYASPDVEAASCICQALREAGIEVWFDQSELRGGDTWDAAIRIQVKECSLFVPLISAHWRLGDHRKYLMEMVARDRIELPTRGFSVLDNLHPGTPSIT
jgi:hypothetical protein